MIRLTLQHAIAGDWLAGDRAFADAVRAFKIFNVFSAGRSDRTWPKRRSGAAGTAVLKHG